MYGIDIVSLDYEFSREVAKRVYIKLKDKEYNTMFLDPYATLFAKVIRLVKSYGVDFNVNKQTQLLIEAAREEHIQDKFLDGLNNSDVKIVNPHSFVGLMWVNIFLNEGIKRVLTKHLIRKIGMIPSYVFFLKLNLDDLREHRKKLSLEKTLLTDSLKGVGFKSRQTRWMRACSKMTAVYDTNSSIIEITDKDATDEIAEIIVKTITDTNQWVLARPVTRRSAHAEQQQVHQA